MASEDIPLGKSILLFYNLKSNKTTMFTNPYLRHLESLLRHLVKNIANEQRTCAIREINTGAYEAEACK